MTAKTILSAITSILLLSSSPINAQAISQNKIHTFIFQEKTYHIVLEKKTWLEATEYATNQGGYLVEITSQEEQDAVFNALKRYVPDFSTDPSTAQDGGGATYAWIGGNDINQEGNWEWNGDNDQEKEPFWQGDNFGKSINDQYNNWGSYNGVQNEPDNYLSNQDGLAIALNNWPQGFGNWSLGHAGQWNDLDTSNRLYFVIEKPISTNQSKESTYRNTVYPNPTRSNITIQNTKHQWNKIILYSVTGEQLLHCNIEKNDIVKINLSNYPNGIYILEGIDKNGDKHRSKIIKN